MVTKNGKVLSKNAVWGDDFILDSHILKRPEAAIALTFVEVRYLKRESLDMVLERFPDARGRIRRACIWMALRRAIVAAAEERVSDLSWPRKELP